MDWNPCDDRVIVRQVSAEGVSPGGIVLPDAAKEKPQRGIVIAVGEGQLLPDGSRLKVRLDVNDEILFSLYGGHAIEVDGKQLLILEPKDILAWRKPTNGSVQNAS